jgi:hypothetical protein
VRHSFAYLAVGIALLAFTDAPRLQSQVRQPRDPPIDSSPTTADSLDSLKAATPDERAIATHFNGWGLKLEPQTSTRFQAAGPPLTGLDARDFEQFGKREPPSPIQVLQYGICKADALAFGHESGRRLLVSSDMTNLVTVLTLQVGTWVWPNSGHSTTTVAYQGGSVFVRGDLYSRPSWITVPKSQDTLLYLKCISQTQDDIYSVISAYPSGDGRLTVGPLSGPVAEILGRLHDMAASCDRGRR